jgi:hypothetical protein
MNWPLLLVLSVIAVAVVWAILRPAGVFVVRVRQGKASAVRGKATDAFLSEVAEVFREFGIASGEVRGVARGRRIALWFSSRVPPAARQRLRNWWVISGWSAGPRRA